MILLLVPAVSAPATKILSTEYDLLSGQRATTTRLRIVIFSTYSYCSLFICLVSLFNLLTISNYPQPLLSPLLDLAQTYLA